MAVSKFGMRDWLLGWLVPQGIGGAYTQAVTQVSSTGVEYGNGNPLPVALQTSSISAAFNPTGEATLAVTSTSARVAMGSAGPTALIVNTGANTAYVTFGNASVVSTTALGHPIPSGWALAFDITGTSFIAAITASSTASLTISTGTGMVEIAASGSAAAAGEAVNLASVGGTTIAIGQAAMAASLPVVIASNQTAVPVSPQAVATGAASFLNIAAGQATTTVKSGAGTLYAIVLNSAAIATNTTTVYDNTVASGTVIGRPAATTATVPTTLNYGATGLAFATGLTIITATANGSDMTVIYK